MSVQQVSEQAQILPMPTDPRFTDLTGRPFGKLKAISYAGQRSGLYVWLCECECGNKAILRAGKLKKGLTLDCWLGTVDWAILGNHSEQNQPWLARSENSGNPGEEEMTYVDRLCDWGWKLGPSSHLIADEEAELHAFAARLGMRRSWAQTSRSGVRHYDLVESRRKLAIELGAIDCSEDLQRFVAVSKGWTKRAIEAAKAKAVKG